MRLVLVAKMRLVQVAEVRLVGNGIDMTKVLFNPAPIKIYIE